MSKVSYTKNKFAQSLYELLAAKRIEEISVAQIAKNAELSLRVFYNHFHDKYELLEYTYRWATENCWFENDEIKSLEDFFQEAWCGSDTLFNSRFRNSLLYNGQNNLRYAIEQKGIEDLYRLMKQNGYTGVLDEELKNILLFYMCGCSRISELFCLGNSDISNDWMIKYGTLCLPERIAKYLIAPQ